LNRGIVLENDVVFGSVNANRRHLRAGHRSARKGGRRVAGAADLSPGRARRLPDALDRRDEDVKVVLDLEQ
jgi:glucose 1-dehydrogenase